MSPRIVAVVKKEFREYRRNKLILLTMALLPAVFLVLPVVALLALPDEVPQEVARAIVGQAMLFYLFVPVVLPSTIAAHTVISEREQRTLEPVLTTPITDRELLVGKAIAATAPAVAMGWLMFVIFVVIVAVGAPVGVQREMATLPWAVAQLTLSPALAFVAVEVGMAISARSTDVRVAQQVAGLAMLPVMGLIALFSFRAVTPTASSFLGAAGVIAAIDAVGWRGVVRLFDRERILTRFG